MNDINEATLAKIKENREMSDEDALRISKMVGLAALKYGDLSNVPAKDYIFDMDRFISFEGNSGPYILYTIVRIKSILEKYVLSGKKVEDCEIAGIDNASEKELMKELTFFSQTMESAYEELAPSKICAYIYDLANALNSFYHETKILTEEDEKKKSSYIALINLTKKVLESCINVLGFEAPERM